MAQSDWAEVRRLAADLQRLQQTSTSHRLTERNCVELVTMLVKRGLLDVLYTRDGKEYVTPSQLEREIRDELIIHGGRINIVDLQQTCNVDLHHIEARISEMVKSDRSLTLLHGEIIERSYMQRLCEEINDLMLEAGQVSLSELSRNFNLPISFLVEHVEAAIESKSISGHLDKSNAGMIYTEAYVNRYRSRIRGMFHAMTVPTAISRIVTEGNYQEKLFNSVLHQLISSGELAGSLQGRQDKAVYIPHIHVHNQNKWADSFLATNGYLEYDVLLRLGIDNPRDYVSQRYCGGSESGDIFLLSTCCVGKAVVSRVEGAVEEALASGHWADSMPLLPSPCSCFDAELLLHHLQELHPELRVFGSVITTQTFIQSCFEHMKPFVTERAKEVAGRNLTTLHGKQDEEKAGRKKRVKKGGKKGRGRDEESEDYTLKSAIQDAFMSSAEIAIELEKAFSDCSKEFMLDVAVNIESSLRDLYVANVNDFAANIGQNTSASELRKRHSELTEKVQALWNMLQLFEKAILQFEGDTNVQLNRYLLRTVCSDLFNLLLAYFAEENGVTLPLTLTAQERPSIINLLPISMKKSLSALNAVLSGKAVLGFIPLFEDLCAEEYCGVMLKRLDKKRERQLLFSHQQSLLEHLNSEQEPSMVFHLVVVILFQQNTHCAIHVPGKLLPQVTELLNRLLESDKYKILLEFQQNLAKQTLMDKEQKDSKSSEQTSMEQKEDTSATEAALLQERLQDSLYALKQLVIKPQKMDK